MVLWSRWLNSGLCWLSMDSESCSRYAKLHCLELGHSMAEGNTSVMTS